MPRLVVEKGADKGKTISLAGVGVVVGRDTSAGISINDTMASRNHFKVEARNGTFYLVDLNSKNGTLLNGSRVKESKIQPGDRIQVGETVFSFMEDVKAKEELIGRIVGRRYKVIERVGRGGMGTVYKAEQIRLNRLVALKMLQQELVGDPTFIKKFMDEARAAAQFNHPNVVTVYEIDVDNEMSPPVPFIAMEYLPGGSVQDMLSREKKLPVDRALAVILDAARGLEYAEKKQIVHRDIKPDNLMVSEDGRIKIGDLGLAKSLKKDGNRQEEGVFGTPHFIAPEQALNKPIDIRADIYALGATFYRILGGTTPYQGASAKEIIVNKLKGPPPSLETLDPGLPKGLVAIVDRMMRNAPEERHATAKELVTELDKLRREIVGTMTGPMSLTLDAGPAGSSASASAIGDVRRPAAPVIVLTGAAAMLIVTVAVVAVTLIRRNNGEQDGQPQPPPPVVVNGGDLEKLANLAKKALANAELVEGTIDASDPASIRKVIDAYETVAREYPGTDVEATARKQAGFWRDQIVRLEATQLWSDAETAKTRFEAARRLYADQKTTFDVVVLEAESAMTRYGEYASRYPEDDRAGEAKDKMDQVDKALDLLRRRNGLWEGLRTAVTDLVSRRQWGAAEAKLTEAAKDPEYADYGARIREAQGNLEREAGSAFAELEAQITTRRAAHDFEGARKLVEQGRGWGYSGFGPAWDRISRAIDDAEKETRTAEAARVRSERVAALREARLRAVDAARGRYDFAGGAGLLRDVRTRMTDADLAAEADAWIADMSAAATGHQVLVDRINSGKVRDVKIELEKIRVGGRPVAATSERLSLEIDRGAKVDVAWKDIRAAEYRMVMKSVDLDWTIVAGLISAEICLGMPRELDTDSTLIDRYADKGAEEQARQLRERVAATLRDGGMHEREAAERLDQARTEIGRQNWQRALDDLNEIATRLNSTSFYSARRAEIDSLQDSCKDKLRK
ncbi:MAG: protein kinase [Candidatus Brocadiae bacterium]|nr:protein kinase [Candidatus Brocadiia bacterium]